MKNKHYQRKVENAKRWRKQHASDSRQNAQGIRIYHVYDPEHPRDLTWWDDFGFINGSQYVKVCWIHPRMKFQDMLGDIGYENTKKAIGDYPPGNPFSNGKPIYKKKGKNGNRKKIVAYEMAPFTGTTSEWHARWKEESKKAAQDDTLKVGIDFKVEQWDWAKGITITYPVELRNEQDITEFALKVKQHLRGEINLFEGLENYEYTAADFRSEVPDYEGY